MKVLVCAMALTLAFAASALASDTVVYPAPKKGNVTFNHKAHSGKIQCKVCHGQGAPGKIAINKEKAHELCMGCHRKAKAEKLSEKITGSCGECHKK